MGGDSIEGAPALDNVHVCGPAFHHSRPNCEHDSAAQLLPIPAASNFCSGRCRAYATGLTNIILRDMSGSVYVAFAFHALWQ
eukprot:12182358-Karenia_brevis.AAC.1